MATAEEVRAHLEAHLVGEMQDGRDTLRVNALEITLRGRTFTVFADVTCPDGRWRVALDYGPDELRIFNGRPSPETVRSIAVVVATQLLEWWHTKESSPVAAIQGVRLP
jgi:hypothetical protein